MLHTHGSQSRLQPSYSKQGYLRPIPRHSKENKKWNRRRITRHPQVPAQQSSCVFTPNHLRLAIRINTPTKLPGRWELDWHSRNRRLCISLLFIVTTFKIAPKLTWLRLSLRVGLALDCPWDSGFGLGGIWESAGLAVDVASGAVIDTLRNFSLRSELDVALCLRGTVVARIEVSKIADVRVQAVWSPLCLLGTVVVRFPVSPVADPPLLGATIIIRGEVAKVATGTF